MTVAQESYIVNYDHDNFRYAVLLPKDCVVAHIEGTRSLQIRFTTDAKLVAFRYAVSCYTYIAVINIGLSTPARYADLCAEYQLQMIEKEWHYVELNVGPVRIAYTHPAAWSPTVDFKDDTTACITFHSKSAKPRRRFMAFWLNAWLFVASLFGSQHELLLCCLVDAVLSR